MDLNTNKIEDIKDFFTRLCDTFICLKSELGITHTKINNLFDSNHTLQKERDELKRENEYLTSQLDKQSNAIKELEQEIKKLKTPIIQPLPPIQFDLKPVQKEVVTLDETDSFLINGVGKIDSDFRGEVCFIFHVFNQNLRRDGYKPGDRIGQLEIERDELVEFIETQCLSETARGEGGFGSTGR